MSKAGEAGGLAHEVVEDVVGDDCVHTGDEAVRGGLNPPEIPLCGCGVTYASATGSIDDNATAKKSLHWHKMPKRKKRLCRYPKHSKHKKTLKTVTNHVSTSTGILKISVYDTPYVTAGKATVPKHANAMEAMLLYLIM